MSIPSNLYAEKVYAEHPIALWSLDEKVDYLSLIDESQRDISDWNMYNATQTDSAIIAGTIYLNENEIGLKYSYDGKFWSTADIPAGYEIWATGYGDGNYLAYGRNVNAPYDAKFFLSSDLRVWHDLGESPYDVMSNVIAYGNGKFVCAGYDNIVQVIDVATKQVSYGNAIAVSDAFGGIAFDPNYNRFVIVSVYEPKSGYSTDGITWTVGGATENNSDYISMIYADNALYALTSYADAKYPKGLIQKSVNGGVTWVDKLLPNGGYYTDIAYGNGTLVVIDSYPEQNWYNAAYSTDGGNTWTPTLILSDQYEWFSVSYFNNRFWAFSYGQDIVASSPDGITWTQDYFNIAIQAVDTAGPQVSTSIIPAEADMPLAPFSSSKTNFIRAVQYVPFSEMMIVSPTVANLDDFDRDKETFSIGAYIYADTPYVLGYDIGYQYYTGFANSFGQRELVRNTRFFSSRVYGQWSYISETFVIPPDSEDISIVIKARYMSNTQNPYEVYDFYINGLSLGQWSEEFQAQSLGIAYNDSQVIGTIGDGNLVRSPYSSNTIVLNTYSDVLSVNYTTGSIKEIDKFSSQASWSSVASGNGVAIAIRSGIPGSTTSPALMAKSYDGKTWSVSNFEIPDGVPKRVISRISFANDTFFVIGSGVIYVSYDYGETWEYSAPSEMSLNGASLVKPKYYNNKLLVVESWTDKLHYSSDGVEWQTSDLPTFAGGGDFWISAAYGNGKYVVARNRISNPSQNVEVAVSSDLESWEIVQLPFTNSLCGSIEFVGGNFVLFLGSNNTAAISSDAYTWTASSHIGMGVTFESYVLNDILISLQTYNSTTPMLTTTTDGLSWQSKDLGTREVSIISPLSVSTRGVYANAYGDKDSAAYYVTGSNSLFAKNTSVPMVYGSGNVTKLFSNPDGPSLIVDGHGFLNQAGRFQEYTFESWIRAHVKTNDLRRIIGPLGSDDGIYVNGPFITLVIGNERSSHFIGDWFRPILVNLKLGIDYANLLVNGEQVISLSFDTNALSLPDSSNDWIGFYAYPDIPSIEIDSVSIYSYQVPSILIRRRLAFGQAVESPEGVNRAYGGTAMQIDYKFADYTNNYAYPAMGRFEQGVVENIDTTRNKLSPPDYSIPELVLNGITEDAWYASLPQAENNKNSEILFEDSYTGYLYFDNFNLSFQSINAIYGIYKVSEITASPKKLFTIKNDAIKSSFSATLIEDKIYYSFTYWGEERSLYFKTGVVPETEFFAGIDVVDVANFFGEDIQTFFSNPKQLKLFIGNDTLAEDGQFVGSIVRFGICTERNLSPIRSSFDNLEIEAQSVEVNSGSEYFGNNNSYWDYFVDGGRPGSFLIDQLAIDHIASYTVVAKSNFGKTYLDVETASYWEDYIPLSHFAQYVDDIFGNKYYDLDFIQFNIDHPAIKKFSASTYDTSEQMVRTFVSFQYLSSGANHASEYFTSVEGMPKNGVIYPGDNWMTTKYEVVNGAVIYPPANVDIEQLAIVTHLDMSVSGISTNPVSVKKIEYASEAFNDFTANPVGTKFGVKLYPYTKYSSLIDYKARNPFKIYKGSTPHLYLTSDSGINRVGTVNPLVPQGLSMPINEASAAQYRMIAMQMFMLYNKDSFSSQASLLFEIEGSNSYLKFYVKSNDRSGKRGRIFAVNGTTGQNENGIAFYVNGKLTRNPVISLDEWTAVGIGFANTLNFDEYPGAIRLSDTILFNNVSYYESTNLQEIERQSKRTWSRINVDYLDWGALLESGIYGTFLWNDVLVLSTISYFGIDPGDIYKAYTGTNKIIIGGAENLVISDPEYRIFSNVEWSTTVAIPV